jgi:hypothetical protein
MVLKGEFLSSFAIKQIRRSSIPYVCPLSIVHCPLSKSVRDLQWANIDLLLRT